MRTNIDRLAHKYALNIKQIRGPAPLKKLDFKNLNKNFYDDIEDNNKTIQADQRLLKKIKDNSFKEFIYTNKEIPNIWKKNNSFQEDFIKTLSNDKNLVSYIGTKNLENRILPPLFEKKNKTISVDQRASPHIIQKYTIKNKFFNVNNFENPKNYVSFSEQENNSIDNSNIKNDYNNYYNNNYYDNTTHNIRNNINLGKSSDLNEKKVNSILEDFKAAYPIQEKLKELYKLSNNNHNSLNDSTKTVCVNGSTTSSLMSSPFSRFNKVKIAKRQKTFRHNIYNNLKSSIDKHFLTRDILQNKRYDNSFNNNNNYNLQSINNEITNPVLKKNIESINFYGPYFSFCPFCRIKNVNYYKNLEPNKCTEIIHFIKKMKNKNNNIFESNRNEPTLQNKRFTLIDETRESDIRKQNRGSIGAESLQLENLDKFDSFTK